LQADGFLDRVLGQHLVDRAVAGDKGQTMDQFKTTAIGERPVRANAGDQTTRAWISTNSSWASAAESWRFRAMLSLRPGR
jgi:hypothetical protein